MRVGLKFISEREFMKLILITNSPVANPGYIVSKTTKKDYLSILKEDFNRVPLYKYILDFNFLYNPFFKAGVKYYTHNNYELVIYPLKKSIGGINDIIAKIYPSSNVITKNTIQESEINYNDPLFCGIFKNKVLFDSLLDSFQTSDSEIIICNLDEVNKYVTEKLHGLGVYLVHDDTLLPSANFSDNMWSYVREGIIGVFGNLNAIKMHLVDKTIIDSNANIGISKKLMAIAPEIGLNFNRKCTYEIQCELNGTLDISKAKQSMHKLNMFSDLKLLASQMIDNPKHLKSIKQNIQLDISFGVNMNMLTLLQGSFEGGYSRQFELLLEF